MADFKRLFVVLGAKTEDFQKNMGESMKKLDKLGKDIGKVGGEMTKWVTGPIVGAGAGLIALATNAGNVADRLLDLSDITGMSTDALQEYQYVAKIAGVNTEAVSSATEGLVRRLPSLVEGESQAAEAMRDLGVSFQQANGEFRSGEAIMDDLITALASMDDPIKRNTLGSQAFGGAWKGMAPILALGVDGIADARKEAQAMGVVMSNDALQGANKFRQGVERLKAQFSALWLELGTKIAPVLKDSLLPIIQDSIIPAIRTFAEGVGTLITWFGNLSPAMQKTVLALGGLLAAVGPVLLIVAKLITAFTTLAPVISSISAALPTLGVAFGVLLSPIALVVAAIVGIGLVIYKFRNEIVEYLGAAIDFIMDFVNKGIELFTGFIDTIKATFEQVKEAVLAPFRYVQDKLGDIGKGIKEALDWINPFKRHSPSLVENVQAGAAIIVDEYAHMADDVGHSLDNVTDKAQGLNSALVEQAKVAREAGQALSNMATNNAAAFERLSGVKFTDADFSAARSGPARQIGTRGIMREMARAERYRKEQLEQETEVAHHHDGVIRIEGINDAGQLQGVADIIMDQLRREVRV